MKSHSIIKIICLSICLICTVFLTFYMNAADGTVKYNNVTDSSAQTDFQANKPPSALMEKNSSSQEGQSDSSPDSSTSNQSHTSHEISHDEPSVPEVHSTIAASSKTRRPRPSRPTSSTKTISTPQSLPSSSSSSSSSQSSQSSNTPPFESEQSSSNPSTDAAIMENSKLAAEMSANFGVAIKIALDEKDFSSEHIQGFAQDTTAVKNQLSQIQTSLKAFPTDFFPQTSLQVNLVLVSQTTTKTMITTNSAIILPCFKTIHATDLKAFLVNLSAQSLPLYLTPDYDALNPPEFLYGNPQAKYNYSQTQPATGYFLSSKAQASAEDDLFETFVAILNQPKTLLKVTPTSPYYQKLKSTCLLLVDWADCFRELAIIKQFV